MIKTAPAFLQYELTKTELLNELQSVLDKKLGLVVSIDLLDWEDGDFTVFVCEDSNSESVQESVLERYGALGGVELTEMLLGELFNMENNLNDLRSYQDDGIYYISVKLSKVGRYKEAWAQADAIQETLDVVMNEHEVWESREILRQRALAVCKLIGDLVPEDMSEYEPIEDPLVITNSKDELIII